MPETVLFIDGLFEQRHTVCPADVGLNGLFSVQHGCDNGNHVVLLLVHYAMLCGSGDPHTTTLKLHMPFTDCRLTSTT